jgi:hypothetical protein
MKERRNLVLCLVIFSLFGLGAYSTIAAAPFAYIPNSGTNNVSCLTLRPPLPLLWQLFLRERIPVA